MSRGEGSKAKGPQFAKLVGSSEVLRAHIQRSSACFALTEVESGASQFRDFPVLLCPTSQNA